MATEFAHQVSELLLPHLPELLRRSPVASPDVGELAGQLGRFCEALRDTNQRINLTGITDAQGMAYRHVLDALLALPACGGEPPLVDLGSGCGVPGIPLALAMPERRVVLVESRERKAAALVALVECLGLAPRVSAVRARGEVWLADSAGGPCVVVTRAVGSIAAQLELLRPMRDRVARLVLLKGPGADEELEAAQRARERGRWPEPRCERGELPGGEGSRTVVVFDLSRRA